MKSYFLFIMSVCLNISAYSMFSTSDKFIAVPITDKQREVFFNSMKDLYFSLEKIYQPLANKAREAYLKKSYACETIAINNLKLKIAKDDLGNCSNCLYIHQLKDISLLALQDVLISINEAIENLKIVVKVDKELNANIDKISQLATTLEAMINK